MLGRLTDVVKYLIIINVIMFVGTSLLMPETWPMLMLFFPGTSDFEPFQLISHMFMHADVMHIVFNMLVLSSLGPPVEHLLGAKRFLNFYLICGFGAVALHLLVAFFLDGGASAAPVLGASGAVFGVAVGFAMKYPNAQLMLLFPPIPVKAKILVPILIAIDLLAGIGSVSHVAGINTGIAHFAHLGGAVTGFIFMQFFGNTARRL